jgi:hypothetical protein
LARCTSSRTSDSSCSSLLKTRWLSISKLMLIDKSLA